jgi:beta-aspartyl-dipeptidase (metallo-type)
MSAILVIENGELLTPEPAGKQTVLAIHGQITQIGNVNLAAIDELGIAWQRIDAEGCYVIPGLIDPHEHLIGGSGEKGYATATPEITMGEILRGGITTVVGCIGTDQLTRNLPSLLGRVKALNEEGISAHMYTGGYSVPPDSITATAQQDIVYLSEVIGIGETAISDLRSSDPSPDELARVVSKAYIGGILSRKCGVCHVHVGGGSRGMNHLFTLLSHHDVKPQSIYPTHVNRNHHVMKQGVDLQRLGVTIDFDTEGEELTSDLRHFLDFGGDLKSLTVSSDASFSSPCTLFNQVRHAVIEGVVTLEQILPTVTRNAANVLAFHKKGRISLGSDADFVILKKADLEIRDVIAHGKVMIRDGILEYRPRALANSNRKIELYGEKKGKSDR